MLDALRQKLRELDADYVPCVFDFDVPKGRRLGESVLSLAGLSRFVIADLTDPSACRAGEIIKEYRSVLVRPVLLDGRKPYALFEDHVGMNVLDIAYYTDVDDHGQA
ncbi:MAG: hypothetical protein ABR540_08455 [Acidimicrobiales bacterium]|nr:hypothetical protein [Actinomycetota bacterium]